MADVFGNQGQFTASDISNFIAANIGNPQAIADAAVQYGISAQDIQSAAGYTPAQQSAYLSSAGVAPTGIAGLPAATPTAPVAPVEPTYGTEKFTAQQIRDYVAANLADPTRIAQAATQFQVKPEDFLQIYTGTETPYSAQQIQDYLKQGTAGFEPRFKELLSSTFGTPKDISSLESYAKLQPGQFNTMFAPSQYAKSSIENIEKSLSGSTLNKYQEANRISNLANSIYGLSPEEAQKLGIGLMKGEKTDTKAKEFYDQLLKTGLTKDLQEQILMDAAVRAPQSKFWQDKPGLREAYTPIDTVKSKPEGAGQYGIDPVTKIPFGSKKAFDDMFKGGEVIKGLNQEFRENVGQDKLGLDPHSAYAGRVAKGIGIFGVEAGQKDITDFDKIEKEIAKLGGIKTQTDAEGNTRQVVYKDVIDPETGNKIRQAVDLNSLFYNPKTEQSDYQKYLDTQNKLREAAKSLGVDASKYTSTKQAYDDLNQKLEGKYLWQGRTDVLDPETAKSLGIDPNDHKKHVTMLMDSVGDKVKATKVIRTFDFQDPNTSRGFFGDLLTGPVLPIALMALSASTGGVSSLLSPLTAPATTALVEMGVPQLLASSITNAAVNSAISAATGGDWQKSGLGSFATNLIGGSTGAITNPNDPTSYTKVFTPGYGEQLLNDLGYSGTSMADLVDPRTLARFGGTYAGSLAANIDPAKILINQAISQGFRSLPGGSTTKSNFEGDLYSFDDDTKKLEFTLSPEQKAALEDEYKKVMAGGAVQPTGITGLPLAKEDWMIDALKDIVPLFMAKGLTKADATMLASNLIGATSKGEA